MYPKITHVVVIEVGNCLCIHTHTVELYVCLKVHQRMRHIFKPRALSRQMNPTKSCMHPEFVGVALSLEGAKKKAKAKSLYTLLPGASYMAGKFKQLRRLQFESNFCPDGET